jgi:hypothetical protein
MHSHSGTMLCSSWNCQKNRDTREIDAFQHDKRVHLTKRHLPWEQYPGMSIYEQPHLDTARSIP